MILRKRHLPDPLGRCAAICLVEVAASDDRLADLRLSSGMQIPAALDQLWRGADLSPVFSGLAPMREALSNMPPPQLWKRPR